MSWGQQSQFRWLGAGVSVGAGVGVDVTAPPDVFVGTGVAGVSVAVGLVVRVGDVVAEGCAVSVACRRSGVPQHGRCMAMHTDQAYCLATSAQSLPRQL